jgi:hypothetical protein
MIGEMCFGGIPCTRPTGDHFGMDGDGELTLRQTLKKDFIASCNALLLGCGRKFKNRTIACSRPGTSSLLEISSLVANVVAVKTCSAAQIKEKTPRCMKDRYEINDSGGEG